MNSHIVEPAQCWVLIVADLDIIHEKYISEVIIIKFKRRARGTFGQISTEVSKKIWKELTKRGSSIKLAVFDRAHENIPAIKFWKRKKSEALICVLNVAMSFPYFLIRGQYTKEANKYVTKLCSLLIDIPKENGDIEHAEFEFTDVDKALLIKHFTLRSKSLSKAKITDYRNLLPALVDCKVEYKENKITKKDEINMLKVQRRRGQKHLITPSEHEKEILKEFFQLLLDIIEGFRNSPDDPHRPHISDKLDLINRTIQHLKRHNTHVSNISALTQDLLSDFEKLKNLTVESQKTIRCMNACMNLEERIHHYGRISKDSHIDMIIQELLKYKKDHQAKWNLIVLEGDPDLEENVYHYYRYCVFCCNHDSGHDMNDALNHYLTHSDEIEDLDLMRLPRD